MLSHPAADNDLTLDVEAQLVDLERRRREALVKVDLETLDQIFAEDMLHVHSTGLVHTKHELLRHIESKRGFLAVERGALTMYVKGDTAVMTGPIQNTMRGRDGATASTMNGFVTQVLRRDGNQWRFTNFQLTVVTEGMQAAANS